MRRWSGGKASRRGAGPWQWFAWSVHQTPGVGRSGAHNRVGREVIAPTDTRDGGRHVFAAATVMGPQ